VEQRTKRLTQALGAVAVATGLGVGAVGLASADDGERDPVLNSSVQVPEHEDADDAAESAALQSAAKVTPEQAKQAALAAVPGRVTEVELENEGGSVVYSVEITTPGTTTEVEVEVDAGNAKVLAQETDHADGEQADASD